MLRAVAALMSEATLLLPTLLAQSEPVPPGLRRNLPAFVANHGQWATPAAFRIDAGGATAWLEPGGMRLDLRCAERVRANAGDGANVEDPVQWTSAGVRLGFVGGMPGEPAGEALRPGRAHFYLGADPAAWRSDVPMFGGARWQQAWPGIDVRVRTHAAGLLEFEVEAAPGVDPRGAVLRWEGVDRLELQADGSLVLSTAAGALAQSAPIAWQTASDGTRLPVPVTVELLPENCFRFAAEPARSDLPVVIDPVLMFHGGGGDEVGFGVARTAAGHVIVTGSSTSAPSLGGRDVFVTCFDLSIPTAPTVVWTAALGGGSDERAFDAAVDQAGFVTIVGGTFSSDFPTTAGALQTAFGGGLLDGFLVQLTSTGTLPGGVATFCGSTGNDWCCRVEMDVAAQATVAGFSDSFTLPAMNANSFRQWNSGMKDTFVIRYAPLATGYVYGTFLGGSGDEGLPAYPVTSSSQFTGESRELGIDVDSAGVVAIAARTSSNGFPVTPGCFQPFRLGAPDATVAILDPSQAPASQLVYSTHLGGTASDGATSVRFGPGTSVAVGGYTYSTNFQSTPGGYQTAYVGPAGFNDGFVAVLDRSQSGSAQLVYSTFLGGQNSLGTIHSDSCQGLLVDACGRITAVGFCSGDSPWPAALNPVQPVHGGDREGIAITIDPRLAGVASLTAATFVGGSGQEVLMDAAREPAGGIVFAGQATSATIPGAIGTLSGIFDALVGKLEMLPALVTRGSCNSGYCAGASVEITIVLDVDQQPAAGAPFALQVAGAPPLTLGAFGLGFGPAAPPLPVSGASLCLGPSPAVLLGFSDACGAASLTINVPAGWPVPLSLHAQALWLAPAACTLPFTSSATLSL